jgi:hypothetical protein
MENSDARLIPRYRFSVEMEITEMQSGIQFWARSTGLSLFGCGVEGPQLLSKGTRLRVKLHHGRAIVEVIATVVYASPETGMGLIFTSIESEGDRILEGWVAELAAIPH